MESERRAAHVYGGDAEIHEVYRVRDMSEPVHGGNREVAETYDTEAEAEAAAKRMNES